MPIDTFEPFRNAMAQAQDTALSTYQIRQQRAAQQREEDINRARTNAMMQYIPKNVRGTVAPLAQMGDVAGVQAVTGMAGQAAEAEQNKREQAITYANRILQAPEDIQPAVYETANQQFFGGKMPPWEQGGREIVTQYAALGEKPEVADKTSSAFNDLRAILGRNPTMEEIQEYKRSGAQNINIDTGKQTPGRTAADKEFAKEYVSFQAAGGAADQLKQLNQLQDALTALESGQELSGPIVGSMPDWVLKFALPGALNTRENVEEVVQRNLRQILGAQFTEKEGERLIKRAFNPNLSEEENAKRLRRLMKQMEIAALMKQDAANYWEQHGTITGWEGKMPTMQDFMNMDFSEEQKPTKMGQFWKK